MINHLDYINSEEFRHLLNLGVIEDLVAKLEGMVHDLWIDWQYSRDGLWKQQKN